MYANVASSKWWWFMSHKCCRQCRCCVYLQPLFASFWLDMTEHGQLKGLAMSKSDTQTLQIHPMDGIYTFSHSFSNASHPFKPSIRLKTSLLTAGCCFQTVLCGKSDYFTDLYQPFGAANTAEIHKFPADVHIDNLDVQTTISP